MHYAVLMRRLHLYPTSPEGALREVVVDDLMRVDAQGVKVFRTFVSPSTQEDYEKGDFVLLTTNKETHLSFGVFEVQHVLRKFCYLLETFFEQNGSSEILLYKDEVKKSGWIVTRSKQGNTVTFTWSPAH